MSTRVHGGPDAQGAPRWDFSTNANACGPAPHALAAVRAADPTRYPDPASTALREALAGRHACTPARIVVAASASEFIVRITTWLTRRQPDAAVYAPEPGYRDYAHAARALGLALVPPARDAQLVWHTEPGSPFGDAQAPPCTVTAGDASPRPFGPSLSKPSPGQRPSSGRAGVVTCDHATLVVDRAYAPLRLEGTPPEMPASAWQLWSPNKALGLTGVRAAYAVAPPGAEAMARELDALAPSWPIGADGVALLHAWCSDATVQWLRESLITLAQWKREQLAACAELGWHCEPSVTPFYVARWPEAEAARLRRLAGLREHGIKLRDAASLGLPGHVRVSVQPPAAQRALALAWRAAAKRPAMT